MGYTIRKDTAKVSSDVNGIPMIGCIVYAQMLVYLPIPTMIIICTR